MRFLLAALLLVAACSSSKEPVTRCAARAECERGQDCVDGLCVASDQEDAGDDDRFDGGPCLSGATLGCATPCGTTGVRTCEAGAFSACVADELCNEIDDDCDSRVDESVTRGCQNACGFGSETCLDGEFAGCNAPSPVAEACNGLDDDCDGDVDEALTRVCETACGGGTETCAGAMYVECSAPPVVDETCNGVDDDCDIRVDEGITRACASACGSGVETCSAGTFTGCTAPPVPSEACNRFDDDCDGASDDGLRAAVVPTTHGVLLAYHGGCTSGNAARLECNFAATNLCGSTCGGRSGLIVEDDSVNAYLLCLGSDQRTIPIATLTAYNSSCNVSTLSDVVCASASHRYCAAAGFTSGIGPLSAGGGNALVGCVGNGASSPNAIAVYMEPSFGTLQAYVPSCNASVAGTLQCRSAAQRFCSASGYSGGFGPVEVPGASAGVVCVLP